MNSYRSISPGIIIEIFAAFTAFFKTLKFNPHIQYSGYIKLSDGSIRLLCSSFEVISCTFLSDYLRN